MWLKAPYLEKFETNICGLVWCSKIIYSNIAFIYMCCDSYWKKIQNVASQEILLSAEIIMNKFEESFL